MVDSKEHAEGTEKDAGAKGAIMCLPDEAKPWFVAQLVAFGLTDIAADVQSDESKEWFGRHYIGFIMAIGSLTEILKRYDVKAQMGGAKPPQPQIAQPDKRIILPN
jgi:hypothetical protein